ncbi:MAG: quercetin dioxygenase-like cupin family protein [Planctomycetota bacterium]|jgi:quercetin dioxygenase-like cupin family protein
MRYRDLIPECLGSRFIASHIQIAGGGPVPDNVYFHALRFQMIFCLSGWVKLVYEDQGDPFVLRAGDCVIQPPHIRHRVLESSPGLEVGLPSGTRPLPRPRDICPHDCGPEGTRVSWPGLPAASSC